MNEHLIANFQYHNSCARCDLTANLTSQTDEIVMDDLILVGLPLAVKYNFNSLQYHVNSKQATETCIVCIPNNLS